MQNYCAEIKIRAERKAGVLIEEQARKPGETDKEIMLHHATLWPKLSDLGIERTQSHRWQAIASLSKMNEAELIDEIVAEEKKRAQIEAGKLYGEGHPKQEA